MKRQNVEKISNMFLLLPSVLDRVSLFSKLQVFKIHLSISIYPVLQLLFVTATPEMYLLYLARYD